jgi:hypothetical protein
VFRIIYYEASKGNASWYLTRAKWHGDYIKPRHKVIAIIIFQKTVQWQFPNQTIRPVRYQFSINIKDLEPCCWTDLASGDVSDSCITHVQSNRFKFYIARMFLISGGHSTRRIPEAARKANSTLDTQTTRMMLWRIRSQLKVTETHTGNLQIIVLCLAYCILSPEIINKAYVNQVRKTWGSPATGHLDTGFLGFPLSLSKCWNGSQISSCYCMLLMQPSLCKFMTRTTLLQEH